MFKWTQRKGQKGSKTENKIKKNGKMKKEKKRDWAEENDTKNSLYIDDYIATNW